MQQGNGIGFVAEVLHPVDLSDDIVEARGMQHLGDGQLADRDDQLWFE